jgi:hypothetical protein
LAITEVIRDGLLGFAVERDPVVVDDDGLVVFQLWHDQLRLGWSVRTRGGPARYNNCYGPTCTGRAARLLGSSLIVEWLWRYWAAAGKRDSWAGEGAHMKSATPKVPQEIGGRSMMLGHVQAAVRVNASKCLVWRGRRSPILQFIAVGGRKAI